MPLLRTWFYLQQMVVSSTLSECFQGHYFPIIHWTSCLLPSCLCQQHQNTITYTSNTIGVPESLPLHQVGHRRESGRPERTGLTQQSDEPLLCVLHFLLHCFLAFYVSWGPWWEEMASSVSPYYILHLSFKNPFLTEVEFLCPVSTFFFSSFEKDSGWLCLSWDSALSSDVSWRTEVLKTVLVEEEGNQKDCSRLTARSECPQLPCSQFGECYLVTLTSGVPINGILGRFPTMSCHHLGKSGPLWVRSV